MYISLLSSQLIQSPHTLVVPRSLICFFQRYSWPIIRTHRIFLARPRVSRPRKSSQVNVGRMLASTLYWTETRFGTVYQRPQIRLNLFRKLQRFPPSPIYILCYSLQHLLQPRKTPLDITCPPQLRIFGVTVSPLTFCTNINKELYEQHYTQKQQNDETL